MYKISHIELAGKMIQVSEKTIKRLILYRRLLLSLGPDENTNVYSYQLSNLTGFGSAQIRRDLMSIGYSGSPSKGYLVNKLLKSISNFIDSPSGQEVAIVGLGHLGRAILDYFQGRNPKLKISLIFDNDTSKINRIIHGCQCYHTNELENRIKENNIAVGIITVPADEAQAIAERLVRSGVNGLVNYAPIKLELPPNIHVENSDMMISVEKTAYFATKLNTAL